MAWDQYHHYSSRLNLANGRIRSNKQTIFFAVYTPQFCPRKSQWVCSDPWISHIFEFQATGTLQQGLGLIWNCRVLFICIQGIGVILGWMIILYKNCRQNIDSLILQLSFLAANNNQHSSFSNTVRFLKY